MFLYASPPLPREVDVHLPDVEEEVVHAVDPGEDDDLEEGDEEEAGRAAVVEDGEQVDPAVRGERDAAEEEDRANAGDQVHAVPEIWYEYAFYS